MEKETLKALQKSIQHWERNASGETEDISCGSCALCNLFLGKGDGCGGCPVREHTGYQRCFNTPYYEAADAYDDDNDEEFLAAAKAEVEFLKSLLPKDQCQE